MNSFSSIRNSEFLLNRGKEVAASFNAGTATTAAWLRDLFITGNREFIAYAVNQAYQATGEHAKKTMFNSVKVQVHHNKKDWESVLQGQTLQVKQKAVVFADMQRKQAATVDTGKDHTPDAINAGKVTDAALNVNQATPITLALPKPLVEQARDIFGLMSAEELKQAALIIAAMVKPQAVKKPRAKKAA